MKFPWYRIVDMTGLFDAMNEINEGRSEVVSANELMFGTDDGDDPQYGPGVPGPWFLAGFGSPCSQGDWIVDGDTIRADGDGGWEHQTCTGDEPMGGWQAVYARPDDYADPTEAAEWIQRRYLNGIARRNRRAMSAEVERARELAQSQRPEREQYFGFKDAMETDGIDRATVTFTAEGLAIFPEKPATPAAPVEPEQPREPVPQWTPEPRDWAPEPAYPIIRFQLVQGIIHRRISNQSASHDIPPNAEIHVQDGDVEMVFTVQQWQAIIENNMNLTAIMREHPRVQSADYGRITGTYLAE